MDTRETDTRTMDAQSMDARGRDARGASLRRLSRFSDVGDADRNDGIVPYLVANRLREYAGIGCG